MLHVCSSIYQILLALSEHPPTHPPTRSYTHKQPEANTQQPPRDSPARPAALSSPRTAVHRSGRTSCACPLLQRAGHASGCRQGAPAAGRPAPASWAHTCIKAVTGGRLWHWMCGEPHIPYKHLHQTPSHHKPPQATTSFYHKPQGVWPRVVQTASRLPPHSCCPLPRLTCRRRGRSCRSSPPRAGHSGCHPG